MPPCHDTVADHTKCSPDVTGSRRADDDANSRPGLGLRNHFCWKRGPADNLDVTCYSIPRLGAWSCPDWELGRSQIWSLVVPRLGAWSLSDWELGQPHGTSRCRRIVTLEQRLTRQQPIRDARFAGIEECACTPLKMFSAHDLRTNVRYNNTYSLRPKMSPSYLLAI